MNTPHPLAGVYAAALTPLKSDFSLAMDDLPRWLDFLAQRGCHGALLFGTTGEGPSFSSQERLSLLRRALEWRRAAPHFRLLAGTGTPSLEETIALTRAAFELGVDGAVALPPYYYKKISDEGLFAWFSQVLQRAVPDGKAFFGYHIPAVSGVGLSLDLLERLKSAFPNRFAGIKDSSGDAQFARQLGERFGADLVVLTGNDRLFSLALQNCAAGCITAMANLFSPDHRRLWEAHHSGVTEEQAQIQSRLDQARSILDQYQPAPPVLKALLARWHNFPRWTVRPPLLPLSPEVEAQASAKLEALRQGI